MPNADSDYNTQTDLPEIWERLGAGTHILHTKGLARRIIAMAAGNWTLVEDAKGTDRPIGAVFQGFVHDSGGVTRITTSADILVYYG